MLKFYVSVVVFSGLLFGMAQEAIADHEIIGAPKCKACHKAKTGDQWKIWTESAHAEAFVTLASEEAQKIAAEKGLGDPQQEDACLKCHATKASLDAGVVVNEKGKYADSEGVGCESCHGPGSDYKSKKVMVDSEAAKAAGLVMNKTADACTQCHNEESPTFKGFDFDKRWAEIAHPVPAEEAVQPESPTETPDIPDELDIPDKITYESSVGDVLFPHKDHVKEYEVECIECHHQIHALNLETPHPDYMTSSRVSCNICHDANPANKENYYKCSDCHYSHLENVADETLSSKVAIHTNCWSCHESGTGVDASRGCSDCHVKDEK